MALSSLSITKVVLKHLTLPPLYPECWDYRCAQSSLALKFYKMKMVFQCFEETGGLREKKSIYFNIKRITFGQLSEP